MSSTRRIRPVDFAHPGTFNRARRGLVENYFESGFRYSSTLAAHDSCVNALVYSKLGGRFLASGGDDRRILLWDLHRETSSEDSVQPSCTFLGHRVCYFRGADSCAPRGGTDDTILKFDLNRWTTFPEPGHSDSAAAQVFGQHADSIREVSCHPSQEDVFLSASDDGCILLHDGRDGSRMSQAQGTLQHTTEITGVRFHPRMEHIFATSDNKGKVCLRDMRMAFGPLHQRSQEGVVLQFATTLVKKGIELQGYYRPEASSISFDSEGTKLAVVLLHYYPTIYSIKYPYPLATCSGSNLPDGSPVPPGTRKFSNSCTVKHGSFGGEANGDDCYAFGSDDFRGYVWKIPPLQHLEEQRTVINNHDNYGRDTTSGTIAFTDGRKRSDAYVPVDLSTPLFHLNGHKSIVNTALIHPVYPLIMTSGIERHIFMHSPTPSTPCASNLSLTPTEVRKLLEASAESRRRFMLAMMGTPVDSLDPGGELGQDGASIELFDEILRQEGEADLFRAATLSTTGSDSDFEEDNMLRSDDEENQDDDLVMD
ncbi:WD40 repeat-like protein [Stereum hirsutum FP-91666 SS1]|uniref:WD40 repeat-like protein n=1 Tax=Stereum hirsutum (strain FP-91666) TaxID=721885 RepID=UPI000444A2D2|nr:WD40 repeat-like protein [Stereum hirsutum FP-91666 SS1]EIM81489.1 WD40 repeat-like protein [Stereum hirsutum FP-91666 SS1]